jgi:hypothetical protein
MKRRRPIGWRAAEARAAPTGKESAVKTRRALTLLLAVVAAGTFAVAAAMAQDLPDTAITADVTATPDRAGTKRNPQGITVTGSGKLTTEPGFEPPIVTGVDLLIGKGVVWNGGKYAKCSKRVLDREGPDGCPKQSIMGGGFATAQADTVSTRVDVAFINGGATQLLGYATLSNPARVRETVVGKITRLSGEWGYRGTIRVPKTLQVVAGVPIRVTGFKFKLGGKPYAKELITTTSCPKGGWRYQARAHYLYDLIGRTMEETFLGRVRCRS